jgi:molecular chaperone DnaK
VRDAELHADEDKKRREEVEVKNQLDTLVYQVEKMLSENREKLNGGDVQTLEAAIGEARKAMEQGGAENMRKALDNLQKASHKLAEVMYQTQGAAPGGEAPPSDDAGGKKDGDVIDAEYEDA